MQWRSQPDSRRTFLKKGLLGGFVLSIGGAGFLLTRSTRQVALPDQLLAVLDPTEYSVLQAVAGRLIPQRAGFPTVQQVGAALNADRILLLADPCARKEVKQLLKLFENALAGFLFGGRLRPFTQLAPEEQDAVLGEWQNSRLQIRRTGFQALRTLAMAAYFGSPLTWAASGYPGPPEGFHQRYAPVWKGGGAKRPEGNGVYHPELSRE